MKTNEIKTKIARAKEYLLKVKEFSSAPDLFTGKGQETEKLAALERKFQLLFDEITDINSAIIISKGKIPESYKSTFYEMSELGYLDHHTADMLAPSARLRNQVVHDYEKLKKSDMVVLIKKYTPLFESYLKTLIKEIA